jgi:hypothetical protein
MDLQPAVVKNPLQEPLLQPLQLRLPLQGWRPFSYDEGVTSTIIKTIKELIADRDEYCNRRKQPRALSHPEGRWKVGAKNNSFHELFQKVISGDDLVLQNLRLYTQPFSGFDLNKMEVVDGRLELSDSTPLSPVSDPWVRRHQRITSFMPAAYRMAMPKVLGERGTVAQFDPQGLINHDAYAYQERINLLYESGVLGWLQAQSSRQTLLEIGGGFGGLACGLLRCLKAPVRYVMVDLPESLLYAALYLQEALPHYAHSFDLNEAGNAIVYVPNYKFDEWLERNPSSVALAVNTLSLVEMSDLQMRYYAEKVSQAVGKTGVFFEQNHDGRWLGLRESKQLLGSHFGFGTELRPRTIPCLLNGRADLWANTPLGFLDEFHPKRDTLPGALARLRTALSDSIWPQFWLLRQLQKTVAPSTFARVKSVWNRLGGKLAS